MDPELAQLVADVVGSITMPGAWPTAAPAAGQTLEQWRADVAQLREQHDALALEASRHCPALTSPVGDAALDVSFVAIEVAPGFRQSAKLYRPLAASADASGRPAVLVLHGGGWWMAGGSIAFELGDAICRALANELDAVVLNFDYRLAPEYPYPTALDDAQAAIEWLVASAATLGIDTRALSVFGISSGGNLAAALARRLRNTSSALALQMLHLPALDLTFSSPSCAADPAWQAHGALLRSYYLTAEHDPHDPGVSPLLADDLAGLPPAVVVVGTFDPLHDDGAQYATALDRAGVSSVLVEYEMTHGIATRDITDRWMTDVAQHARRMLAK